jgi:hypothetical protein
MVVQTPIDTARITFSGVLYLNYQYRLHPSGGVNRFDVDRAYLNVAGPLGNRISFRITSDVYQVQSDTVNRSWQLRAKYAYGQYDFSRSASWPGWVRLGMVQNMFIDHDEAYWPRWLSPAATDRQGYFSSADVGVLARLGLPSRKGEILATILNGPGFASREVDRFKDFGARLSITPLAEESGSPWRTLTLALWAYKGAVASRFVPAGRTRSGPVGSSLRRDRWGVFTAVALCRERPCPCSTRDDGRRRGRVEHGAGPARRRGQHRLAHHELCRTAAVHWRRQPVLDCGSMGPRGPERLGGAAARSRHRRHRLDVFARQVHSSGLSEHVPPREERNTGKPHRVHPHPDTILTRPRVVT